MAQLKFNGRDELILIDPDQIAYIESLRNNSKIILNTGESILISINLKSAEDVLSAQLGKASKDFMRVGRQHIVRLSYVINIHTLQNRISLFAKPTAKHFELKKVSTESLKKLKAALTEQTFAVLANYQLRDMQNAKSYPIKVGESIVGRKSTASTCDIEIDNGDVLLSRKHFVVKATATKTADDFSFEIVDGQSANGTYINQEKIDSDKFTKYSLGDIITAGKTNLVIEKIDEDETIIL